MYVRAGFKPAVRAAPGWSINLEVQMVTHNVDAGGYHTHTDEYLERMPAHTCK